MDFESMLDSLAEEYPSIKEQALDLKEEVIDLMPADDSAPIEAPELDDLDLGMEPEDELEL